MTSENRPLRPAILVPRYWPNLGGAEQHTRRLVHEISDRCMPTVLRHSSTEGVLPDLAYALGGAAEIDDDGVPVRQVTAQGLPRRVLRRLGPYHARSRVTRALYGRLARASLRRQLQTVTAGHDLVHAVYNGFTASAEAAARLGKPFVWTPLAHTTLPSGEGWSSPQFRRLYRRADALIAMTDYERDWLIAHGAPAHRVHVCPVAPLLEAHPDPTGFRARHGLTGKPLVLFLGRLVDYKGYRVLAEAGRGIWAEHPEARLVFLGPDGGGAAAVLEAFADPRLLNLGVLSDAEKTAALAACDLLCVPSSEESLGVVYLEAWSFGKPVIAADIPVLRTVVDHEVDGLLVRQEANAVAAAVSRLLHAPQLAARMGQAGRAKAQRQYDWSTIGDRLLAIYAAVMGRDNARRP